MSRYLVKKSSSHSPHPRPPFGRPRTTSWYDEGSFLEEQVVYDLSVYDVEAVATGLVDEDGNEILKTEAQEFIGFFPLS